MNQRGLSKVPSIPFFFPISNFPPLYRSIRLDDRGVFLNDDPFIFFPNSQYPAFDILRRIFAFFSFNTLVFFRFLFPILTPTFFAYFIYVYAKIF